MKTHADLNLRELVNRFSSEMSGIKTAFQSYAAKWTEAMIRSDPAAFIDETKKILAALGDRIRRENAELYPAVDKLG